MAYYSGGGGGGGKLSAVDAILAEAADLVALEQIARLNTAHLAADDAALPSVLEARFRKLKSLPPSSAAPAAPPPVVRTLARSVTAPAPRRAASAALLGPNPPAPAPPERHPPAAPAHAAHEDAETKDAESSPLQARAPAPVPATHAAAAAAAEDDEEDLERLFGSGTRGRPALRERNGGRSSSSSSSFSSSASPPPPRRQACCFGFSPKKKKPLQKTPSAKTKKKVHHGGSGDVLDADEWGDENRRVVSELREQQRRIRQALVEQVEVSRETAKMARWVKQASARMTHVQAIDDLLSDCEDDDEEEEELK